MDIGINREGSMGDFASKAQQAGKPEWHGLRARLAAARSARRALAEEVTTFRVVSAGSFDRPSARVLADYDPFLKIINPVFWANRKPARTMDAPGVGETSPGGRG